jgi:TIR domain
LQDKLLLILSEKAVTSKWVRYEVNRALDWEINQERTILFPIRLDDAVLHAKDNWAHALRSSRHIGNFTHWREHQGYQKAFTQLLEHLKDETK